MKINNSNISFEARIRLGTPPVRKGVKKLSTINSNTSSSFKFIFSNNTLFSKLFNFKSKFKVQIKNPS